MSRISLKRHKKSQLILKQAEQYILLGIKPEPGTPVHNILSNYYQATVISNKAERADTADYEEKESATASGEPTRKKKTKLSDTEKHALNTWLDEQSSLAERRLKLLAPQSEEEIADIRIEIRSIVMSLEKEAEDLADLEPLDEHATPSAPLHVLKSKIAVSPKKGRAEIIRIIRNKPITSPTLITEDRARREHIGKHVAEQTTELDALTAEHILIGRLCSATTEDALNLACTTRATIIETVARTGHSPIVKQSKVSLQAVQANILLAQRDAYNLLKHASECEELSHSILSREAPALPEEKSLHELTNGDEQITLEQLQQRAESFCKKAGLGEDDNPNYTEQIREVVVFAREIAEETKEEITELTEKLDRLEILINHNAPYHSSEEKRDYNEKLIYIKMVIEKQKEVLHVAQETLEAINTYEEEAARTENDLNTSLLEKIRALTTDPESSKRELAQAEALALKISHIDDDDISTARVQAEILIDTLEKRIQARTPSLWKTQRPPKIQTEISVHESTAQHATMYRRARSTVNHINRTQKEINRIDFAFIRKCKKLTRELDNQIEKLKHTDARSNHEAIKHLTDLHTEIAIAVQTLSFTLESETLPPQSRQEIYMHFENELNVIMGNRPEHNNLRLQFATKQIWALHHSKATAAILTYTDGEDISSSIDEEKAEPEHYASVAEAEKAFNQSEIFLHEKLAQLKHAKNQHARGDTRINIELITAVTEVAQAKRNIAHANVQIAKAENTNEPCIVEVWRQELEKIKRTLVTAKTAVSAHTGQSTQQLRPKFRGHQITRKRFLIKFAGRQRANIRICRVISRIYHAISYLFSGSTRARRGFHSWTKTGDKYGALHDLSVLAKENRKLGTPKGIRRRNAKRKATREAAQAVRARHLIC